MCHQASLPKLYQLKLFLMTRYTHSWERERETKKSERFVNLNEIWSLGELEWYMMNILAIINWERKFLKIEHLYLSMCYLQYAKCFYILFMYIVPT